MWSKRHLTPKLKTLASITLYQYYCYLLLGIKMKLRGRRLNLSMFSPKVSVFPAKGVHQFHGTIPGYLHGWRRSIQMTKTSIRYRAWPIVPQTHGKQEGIHRLRSLSWTANQMWCLLASWAAKSQSTNRSPHYKAIKLRWIIFLSTSLPLVVTG